MSDRFEIRKTVAAFLADHPAEADRLAPFTDFLAATAPADYASRKTIVGHVTVSAFVLSPDFSKLLVIFHLKLNRFLQPGGHIENDASLAAGAAREVQEETGLPLDSLHLLSPNPIDIDPHRIPASEKKGEPAHWHFDIRYLFVAGQTKLTADTAEVAEARWLPLDSPTVAEFIPRHVLERIQFASRSRE